MNKLEFTDEPFMSAKAKRQLHKEMWNFLDNDMAYTRFTKRLYEFFHLHLDFPHYGGRHEFHNIEIGDCVDEFRSVVLDKLWSPKGEGDQAHEYDDIYTALAEMFKEFDDEAQEQERRDNRLSDFRRLANEIGFPITDDQMQDLADQQEA